MRGLSTTPTLLILFATFALIASPAMAQSKIEPNPGQLRSKTLPEGTMASRSELERNPSGWTDLMPKPGFPGWSKVPIPATASLNPKEQWSIRDGVLTIDGSGGHEWLRFDGKTFRNFVLHVEWRFRKLEGKPRYNGGVYFWATADGRQFYQAQTGEAGGWLFGDFPKEGDRNRINLHDQMLQNRMAPIGEWNTFEIRATAELVELWVNGGVQSRWPDPPITGGLLGIEAEGYQMDFRRLLVKELP